MHSADSATSFSTTREERCSSGRREPVRIGARYQSASNVMDGLPSGLVAQTGTFRSVERLPVRALTSVLGQMSGRRAPLAILVGSALSLAGCGAAAQPLVVHSIAAISSRHCTAFDTYSNGAQVTVDPDPVRVTALWLPGPSATCMPVTTYGDSTEARALASDIRSAPHPPSGTYNCPSDSGTGVELYLSYARSTSYERADIDLTGCGSLSAPDRSPKSATLQLRHDLRPIAPQPWLRWVSAP